MKRNYLFLILVIVLIAGVLSYSYQQESAIQPERVTKPFMAFNYDDNRLDFSNVYAIGLPLSHCINNECLNQKKGSYGIYINDLYYGEWKLKQCNGLEDTDSNLIYVSGSILDKEITGYDPRIETKGCYNSIIHVQDMVFYQYVECLVNEDCNYRSFYNLIRGSFEGECDLTSYKCDYNVKIKEQEEKPIIEETTKGFISLLLILISGIGIIILLLRYFFKGKRG